MRTLLRTLGLIIALLTLVTPAFATDVKISNLPAASAADGTEVAPVVQGAATKKMTTAQIKTFTSASPTLVTPALGTPSSGTLTNATGLPIGGLSFYTAPTTADANADANFGASAAGKKPFVVQTKVSNTADAFDVQYSDGTCYFCIQRDGNVIIDQKFGAVASKPLDIKYSGSEVAYVSYLGLGSFNGGLTVNGYFTADATTGAILTNGSVQGNQTLKTLTESSATKFVTMTVASGAYLNGHLVYSVEADDGADFQNISGEVPFAAVNKAGAITCSIGDPTTAPVINTTAAGGYQVTAVSSGTLTMWGGLTCVDDGSNVMSLKANAVSSLTQTTLRIRYRVELLGTSTVTAQ